MFKAQMVQNTPACGFWQEARKKIIFAGKKEIINFFVLHLHIFFILIYNFRKTIPDVLTTRPGFLD